MLTKFTLGGLSPLQHLKRRGGDGFGFTGAGPFPAHSMRAHQSAADLFKGSPGELARQASLVIPEREASFVEAAGTLLEANIKALPLTQNVFESATDIIELFCTRYEGKQDKRNSLNDLLILSHARWAGLRVASSDKVPLPAKLWAGTA